MTPRVTAHLKVVDRKEGPVWFIKSRVPGREPVQTTRRLAPAHVGGGPCPPGSMTRKEAKAALEAFLVAERERVGSGAYVPDPNCGVLFRVAAAEYLENLAFLSREDSTIADYRGVLDGYLIPRFGERPLESITRNEVEAYRNELKSEGRLTDRTIVRHLVVFGAVYRRAAEKWQVTHNPTEGVAYPKAMYSGEYQVFSPSEFQRLVEAAADDQEAALYMTAWWTGLRMSELLALKWKDVDFTIQRVHVRRSLSRDGREKVPKSGRVRSSLLTVELVRPLDLLSQRKDFTGPEDYVFCNEAGDHLNQFSVRRRYYATADRAKVRRLNFHSLRHGFGTMAVQEFMVPEVQEFMGHADIKTTMRYVHAQPGANAADRLSSAWKTLVSREMSRNGLIGQNSGDLSATEVTV